MRTGFICPASAVAGVLGWFCAGFLAPSLQLGIGRIPDAMLPYLTEKHDLGIHTEMFSDGVLTLALQASAFHREMLNDRGNKELINEAVQRHVAAARRFELDPNGVAPAGGGGARNHPAVQAALSAFQGEVVAVRPRTPEEGESP